MERCDIHTHFWKQLYITIINKYVCGKVNPFYIFVAIIVSELCSSLKKGFHEVLFLKNVMFFNDVWTLPAGV